jgi:hypothetical protein
MKVQIDSYFKIEDTRIKLKHLYSILIEKYSGQGCIR